MPKKLTLGSQAFVLEGEVQDTQISEIEAAYKDAVTQLESQVTSLNAKIKELTPNSEPEIPEVYRVRLEALEVENKRLEQERRNEKVNLVLEKARNHRDTRGYGHDKVFLDLAEAALKMSAFEQDGVSIKLESTDKVSDLIGFFNRIVMTMLEKVPGTVPMNGKTTPDEVRLISANGDSHYTLEEFEKAQEDFWK